MDIFKKCYDYTEPRDYQAVNFYPFFRALESRQDTEVYYKGKKMLMLGSNSYLGLTTHPEVQEASRLALEKYGTGNAGSRFLNGTLDLHRKLEAQLSEFFGYEDCLLFGTGYQTVVGTISCLVGPRDYCIMDKMNHASIIDGSRLSFGKSYKYEHNDIQDMDRLMKQLSDSHGKLVVVDGIFSMEGDIVDLPGVVQVAKKYGARVMIDDAHGGGVLGPNGKGTAAHFRLRDSVDITTLTFSKSFAALGGAALATREVIDYLKHHSRALIFSASIPAPTVAAVSKSIDILQREPERVERLWQITHRMLAAFKEMGYKTGKSETPVIPIYVGERDDCFRVWQALTEEGIFVNPVPPPAVPDGHALIRTSYMATHTDDQLDFALEVFRRVGQKLHLIPS